MPTTEQMARIPLFEGLPEDQLADLASIAVEKTVVRGGTIFSEGQTADGFYVALEGKVKIFKLGPDGKEQILHIFGPGEPFGEVPVFEGAGFPAHAIALEKSRICFLSRTSFVKLISRTPAVALNMLAVLSRRLRKFTVLVDDLSLKEVPARLAAHLLYLSDKQRHADRVRLEAPKNQLAGMLGTIPETLSRILNRMAREGYIVTEGAEITITDREGLRELAEGLRRLT